MKTTYQELYGKEAAGQKARYESIQKGFAEVFGSADGGEWFSAPGRMEIGGNHTDHNHGRVLTAAVNLDIVGLVKKTDNGVIRLKSAEYDKIDEVSVSDLEKRPEVSGSQSLIRGICAKCRKLGYQVGGFDCYTMTRVMKGSGLSSSAAFEVLVVTILSHLYNEDSIDPVTAAIVSQYAENVYFEKPSGLLDQMASSVAGFTSIDFRDPLNPVIEKIDFDFDSCGYAVCVVDTGGNHANLTGEYAAIPAEMKQVAQFFGKEFLRDVDETEFYDKLGEVRKVTGDRAVLRAMHFFDDDRLAAEEAAALKRGDFDSFRKMIRASGLSSLQRLQNVFATVSPAEQGITLALSLTEKILGRDGAFRVHGGGFAGTIEAFVPQGQLEEYRAKIEKVFGEGSCHVLSVRQAGGTKVVL
ncbi:galactokinase [uncultured Neglectibacter sp.]|uniref:galactokinase n=1 Tax=uncultured Neglectibacter sp. TaxID=1924108 RepID=UPI0034DFEDDA